MKLYTKLLKTFFYGIIFLNTSVMFSQQDSIPKTKNLFWSKVQYGGGLGLAVGNGFTNVSLSPTAYYNFDKTFTVGVGLTGSYVAQESNPSNYNSIGYKSTIFGGSLIGMMHPIQEIQLSAEVEQLKVNRKFDEFLNDDSFWNTALFLGAGYRAQNVTLGVKFNVLHNNDNNQVYSQAWLPFVRIMF